MQYIKKDAKIYRLAEEINKVNEISDVNKKLEELEAQRENKLEQINKTFDDRKTILIEKKNELNNL